MPVYIVEREVIESVSVTALNSFDALSKTSDLAFDMWKRDVQNVKAVLQSEQKSIEEKIVDELSDGSWFDDENRAVWVKNVKLLLERGMTAEQVRDLVSGFYVALVSEYGD